MVTTKVIGIWVYKYEPTNLWAHEFKKYLKFLS